MDILGHNRVHFQDSHKVFLRSQIVLFLFYLLSGFELWHSRVNRSHLLVLRLSDDTSVADQLLLPGKHLR